MSSTTELQTWLNGTPTGGPNSDGRYPLTAKDGQVYLVYCPAAQALNPSLADLPVQIYSEQAQAAATGAAADAADADAARIAAQAAAASAAADSANALSSRNTATTQATNAAASAASALASKNAAEVAAASFVAGDYRRTDTAVPWSDLSSVPSFASRWPTYTEVTDKPTTFAPSAHNHDASEITAGILPAARFNDTAHGNRSGGALHAAATTSVAGFMAAADKLKLDGIVSFGGNLAALTISPRNFSVVDNTIATGLWRYSESDSDSGGPIASDRGAVLHTRRAAGGGEIQFYLSEISTRAFMRSRVTGAWSTWAEFGRLSGTQDWTATNVFTGGYLVNRRVVPRLYLESPNQVNGYYLDSNVSDAVFGDLTVQRRDNTAVIFRLTNAGALSGVSTITSTGAITAAGILTGRTQTRVQNADNSHSMRMEIGGDNSKNLLASGGVAPLYIGNSFGVTDQPVYLYNNNAVRLTIAADGVITAGARYATSIGTAGWTYLANFSGTSAGGVWADSASRIRFVNAAFSAGIDLTAGLTTVYGDLALGDNKRISFRPDALVGHTTDLPSHAVINLSANYHNNNLLGVSAEHGVYAASDAGFSWLYKSGATWRNVMDLNIGAAGASALLFDGQISDVAGNVRDIVTVQRNASANFTTADRGKAIVKDNTTAYNWTCDTTSGVKDQAITVINDGTAGDVTIVQGASMTVISGSTTGNFVLTPGQSRTLLWLSSTRVRVL
jgi:hypothetical protein